MYKNLIRRDKNSISKSFYRFTPEPLPKNIAPHTAEFFLQNVVGY
jgi:hypothetical protein